MNTNDNATEIYRGIVLPIFRKAERLPYFEWRMNGFVNGIFEPLLRNTKLEGLVKEFARKYSSSRNLLEYDFLRYGRHHGRKIVSMDGTKKSISISYLRHWIFDWSSHGERRCGEIRYEESAWPDDCVNLSLRDQDFYLSDLASVQSAILLEQDKTGRPLTKLKFNFTELDKRTREDLALKLIINGVIASFQNDSCYRSMEGNINLCCFTGRGVGDTFYVSQDNSVSEYDTVNKYKDANYDKILKEVRRKKRERKRFEIVRFTPPKLRSGAPSRMPSVYCTGSI